MEVLAGGAELVLELADLQEEAWARFRRKDAASFPTRERIRSFFDAHHELLASDADLAVIALRATTCPDAPVARRVLALHDRSIGLLAGPAESHSGQQRAQGYHRAMHAADIVPPKRWQIHCPPQVDGGRAAARELLDRAPELTVLVAYNDLVAVGALQACAEMGRNIPHDTAVCGYDDIPLAALVTSRAYRARAPVVTRSVLDQADVPAFRLREADPRGGQGLFLQGNWRGELVEGPLDGLLLEGP